MCLFNNQKKSYLKKNNGLKKCYLPHETGHAMIHVYQAYRTVITSDPGVIVVCPDGPCDQRTFLIILILIKCRRDNMGLLRDAFSIEKKNSVGLDSKNSRTHLRLTSVLLRTRMIIMIFFSSI